MPTLSDCLRTFLLEDRSPATHRNYKNVLDKLVKAIGPGRDITLVTYADLLDYISRIKPSLKRSSQVQYVQVIKAFFSWCAAHEYIKTSPAQKLVIRRPRKDRGVIRAMPAEVLKGMIDLCKYEPRNLAIILFMADTGCRVGGAASLTLENLDLVNLTAVLVEKGGREVPVYFGEETAGALRNWIKHRPAGLKHGYVFTTNGEGRALRASTITDMIRKRSKTVCGQEYGPHSIRHLVGNTWAHLEPLSVTQRKLNHEDPESTLIYYPDSDELIQKESLQHSLAALKSQPESKPSKPKIVRFEDYAG